MRAMMTKFIENLKGNAFHFMCAILGSLLVVIFMRSHSPITYVAGIVVAWVAVSLLGVNLAKKVPDNRAPVKKNCNCSL